MATGANKESSSFPSERYCKDRYSAYKKLLADLAQHLGREDVKVIAFNCNLAENLKQSSALDVLDYLDKHAKFSPINIQPLAELLTDAYRNDLVHDYVERYGLKYGRHNSVPSPRCKNQLQAARRREVYSSPDAYPPVQETGDFSPENNPFSPTEDTLHEDESACNKSSNETRPPLVQPFSHPQTLTITNYAHPKTVHQFNDQMQPGAIKGELQTSQGASNQTRENIMPSAITPLHFRRTSTPTQVHQSRRFHNHSGTTTPGSISSSSSMHEMNNYHNPGFSEQDMLYGSSAVSANASQDLLSAQPTTQLEHSLSSTHIRSKEHHSVWYHSQASSQGSLLSEQALGNLPPQISNQASQYPTENSLQLSNERVVSKPTHHRNGGYNQVDFHRRASSPAATSRSAQKQASSFHSSYPRKKTSAAGSTVSDSGVEMVHIKTPSAGPSSDIIEPWMSVSNEHQYWIQPRPRVTSVSTGVQTEGEGGSEKTASPASGSPRTSNSPQHTHAESEDCNEGQDSGKQETAKKACSRLPLTKSRPSKPQHTFKWDLKRNKLNKKIYKHKEKECITCKKKLELYAGCGGANPRLVFHLVPYGLEDDAGKSATLEIEVEISRKTRMSMHSSTKIRLSVFVQEMKEGNLLTKHENIEQSIDVSRFFIPRFVTHECLKLSRCEQIEIQASAELIPHSEHPTN